LPIALLWAALAAAAPLSESHRRFLREELAYLITPREREAFAALESDAQRDAFIAAFWKARDPVPETEVNERRQEHYRRLRHANQHLGRGTSQPGWRTDQGRAYILLGAPRTVERHGIEGPTFPLELWFYTAAPDSGLPTAFFLMFVRKQGVGELRLYDPLTDGAASLLTGADAELLGPRQIYRLLQREVSPDVASAAFNLDPSVPLDTANPRPSLASVDLMAKIETLPERLLLRPDYIERLGQPVEQVATRYAFNPLRIEGQAAPWWDGPDRTRAEVALWLEPQQVTVLEEAGGFILAGSLALSARDPGGKVVASRERRLEIPLSESQLERARSTPILILDRFPLAPGRYQVDATLQAAQSDAVATWSGALEIRPPAGLSLGPALAAHLRPGPTSGSTRTVPTVPIYVAGDPIRFLFQVAAPAAESAPVEVVATLERDGREQCRSTVSLPAAPGSIQTQAAALGCAGLAAGDYLLRLAATAPGLAPAQSSSPVKLIEAPRPLPNLIGSFPGI
jgi:GWxTD domain-containing protein